jgi:hypothetical protein
VKQEVRDKPAERRGGEKVGTSRRARRTGISVPTLPASLGTELLGLGKYHTASLTYIIGQKTPPCKDELE